MVGLKLMLEETHIATETDTDGSTRRTEVIRSSYFLHDGLQIHY